MVFVLINLHFLKSEMVFNNEKCEFAVEWLLIFLGFDVFTCIDNVMVGDVTFNDFVKFSMGFEFCGNGKKVGKTQYKVSKSNLKKKNPEYNGIEE